MRWLTGSGAGKSAHCRRTVHAESIHPADDAADIVTIVLPVTLKRRGVEGRLIVGAEAASDRTPDQPLVDLLGRAHAYLGALTDGRAANTVEVAALYGVHRAEVSRILPLAFLAPGITAAILNGRQPVEFSARKLSRQIDLPVAWDAQTSLFGL